MPSRKPGFASAVSLSFSGAAPAPAGTAARHGKSAAADSACEHCCQYFFNITGDKRDQLNAGGRKPVGKTPGYSAAHQLPYAQCFKL